MAAPICYAGDFDGPILGPCGLAEKAGERHPAPAVSVTIYDGGSRADAARLGGVGLQTHSRLGPRFNFRGPDGLVDGKSTGHPSKLNDEQRRALVAMVEAGPTPAVHGVVRWRLIDLAQWVFDEYRISVTKRILEPRTAAAGLSETSARPRHHAHDEAAVAAFKKKVPDILATIAATSGKPPRTLVPRRSPHRSEKQGHATLGGTRHATFCLEGSANRLRPIFSAPSVPGARQGGRSRPPLLQHRGHDLHLRGDRRSPSAPGAHAVLFVGSGRMACHREAGRARKHSLDPPTVQSPD